ncbi:MAG: rRNA maturation RNase YbeY [Thermodesulfovibrionales bacterium]
MPILISNIQRTKKPDRQRIERDLDRALQLLGLQTSELSILFVGNRKMRDLNYRYRGLDKTTDVLSFPLTGGPAPVMSPVLGDIVVCVPKALLQAEEYNVPFYDEVLRLLIHGLLHLAGYDHEKSLFQRARMENKERELLDAIAEMD